MNQIWNRIFFENQSANEVESDSSKFRKFLELIITPEHFNKILFAPPITSLSEISPLIHNDQKVSRNYGSPFSLQLSDQITSEHNLDATAEHREFNEYLERSRAAPTSRNRKKFINKLARLLYLVRSNIAHGSKLQYQGSARNEEICKIIYSVLLTISNLILDNGLLRIAAYGELKRGGRLYQPLVNENQGLFIRAATVVGGTISSDNSVVYNPQASHDRTTVDIIEFQDADCLKSIDLVECMQRSLVPYYRNDTVIGFAWIYHRFADIENKEGPITHLERGEALHDRCKTFLYSLSSVKQIYRGKTTNFSDHRLRLYGDLVLELGQKIVYTRAENEQRFIHPLMPNIISMIEDIGNSYNIIFQTSEPNFPFSQEIGNAIFEDYLIHQKFYTGHVVDETDEIAQKVYHHLVGEIISFIAFWVCEKTGDSDGIMWENLNSNSHQMN